MIKDPAARRRARLNTKRRYTEQEDEIIKATFPGHGTAVTQDALATAGYVRTRRSVAQRAWSLRIRAGINPRGQLPGDWTEEEDAIIDNDLPPRRARAWLERAGFQRSTIQIKGRRRRLRKERANA